MRADVVARHTEHGHSQFLELRIQIAKATDFNRAARSRVFRIEEQDERTTAQVRVAERGFGYLSIYAGQRRRAARSRVTAGQLEEYSFDFLESLNFFVVGKCFFG